MGKNKKKVKWPWPWRCSECKKVAHPRYYLDLRCRKCGAYGLEKRVKKGKWVLVI